MFSSFPEGEEGWGLGESFSRTTVALSLHSGVPIWRSSRLFALTQQQTIIVRLPKLNAAEMSSSFRLWSNLFLMLLVLDQFSLMVCFDFLWSNCKFYFKEIFVSLGYQTWLIFASVSFISSSSQFSHVFLCKSLVVLTLGRYGQYRRT